MTDNRPRPYSRLNPTTGRIEWVTPEESARGPNRRSRLESDAEVRSRIALAGHMSGTSRTIKGEDLDGWLKYWDMAPRGFVDE